MVEKYLKQLDDAFLAWLKEHIGEIKILIAKLDDAINFYNALREKENFGWIPSQDFIKKLNEVQYILEYVLSMILSHQRIILEGPGSGKISAEESKELKNSDNAGYF